MNSLILGLVNAIGGSAMGFLGHDFGQIYVTGAVGSQTPGTSFTNITQWTANGVSNGGVVPAFASNKINITAPGNYLVMFQCSFQGTTGKTMQLQVELDGVDQPQVGCERKIGTGTDTGSASGMGIIQVATNDEDLELHVKCQGAADVFDLREGQLVVLRI